MKKIILSTLAIFSFIIFTNAQSLHLGVKGGVNLSKVDGVPFKDGYDAGFQLGGFASFDFNKSVGVQVEVLYNQTNTKFDTSLGEAFNPLHAKNISLNYIAVPLLLKLNASKLLTFNVGPQFGILTNTHETVLQNGIDAVKSGDLSMVLGAQVNLGGINVYGRYNIGLANISDVQNQSSWKSQQIQLGIGLRLL